MAARGPKNSRRDLEWCPPVGFWTPRQLSLDKFFDPSTPSMRKVDDGGNEKKKEKKKKNVVYSGH